MAAMEKLSRITSIINDYKLTDLIVGGYTDILQGQRPIHHFHMSLHALYIVFEEAMIQLRVINNFSQLKVSVTDTITLDFDLDEDTVLCACSLSELYGLDYYYKTNYVDSFRCFLDQTSNLDEAVCRAVELQTSYNTINKVFFFDPAHYFGFHIGGSEYSRSWIDENAYLVDEYGSFHWVREEGKSGRLG